MTTYFGFVLLLFVIAGGIYLYSRVERLSREIDRQTREPAEEPDDKNR